MSRIQNQFGFGGRHNQALSGFSAILGAALRLMKVSHVETQKILYELNGHAEAAYETAAAARLSDMAGYAPLTEVLAAAHAKAHVRLFMN